MLRLDIFQAIRKPDMATTLEHLNSGCDVDMKNGDGYTLLMISCADNIFDRQSLPEHRDMTELLLLRGASLHERTTGGQQALHRAALWGTPQSLKLLLDHKASVNDRSDGYTALWYAAQECRVEHVKLLLEYKADPSIRCGASYDRVLKTPLEFIEPKIKENEKLTVFVDMLENLKKIKSLLVKATPPPMFPPTLEGLPRVLKKKIVEYIHDKKDIARLSGTASEFNGICRAHWESILSSNIKKNPYIRDHGFWAFHGYKRHPKYIEATTMICEQGVTRIVRKAYEEKQLVIQDHDHPQDPGALHVLAEHGHIQPLQLLVDEFKINPRNQGKGDYKYPSPLSIALEKNQTEIIKFLVSRAGCDLLTERLGRMSSRDGWQQTFVYERMNEKQKTLVHSLLQEAKELETFLKKFESVKKLDGRLREWYSLGTMGSPSILNKSSLANFQEIINLNIIQDYSHLTDCFFDNIDPYFSDIPRPCVDSKGYSYNKWEIVCMSNDLKAVDYACEQGWAEEARNQMGMSILEFAGCVGSIALVQHLISKYNYDPENSALLHFAAARGHLPLIKYLIKNAIVHPGCLDESKDNVLPYAAQGGQVNTLRYFLDELPGDERLDVNVKTSRSVGLLHYAIEGFDIPTMIFLLQRGVPQFAEIRTKLDPEKLFEEYRYCLAKLVSDPDFQIKYEKLRSDFPKIFDGLKRIHWKYKQLQGALPKNYQAFLQKSSLEEIIHEARHSKQADELRLKQKADLEAKRVALRTSTQGIFKTPTGSISQEVKQVQAAASPHRDLEQRLEDISQQLTRALEELNQLKQQLRKDSTPSTASTLALGRPAAS